MEATPLYLRKTVMANGATGPAFKWQPDAAAAAGVDG